MSEQSDESARTGLGYLEVERLTEGYSVGVRVKRAGRGVPLIGGLVLLVLYELVALGINFLVWRQFVEHAQSNPAVPVGSMVIAVVALMSLVGVWLWQRKAVYLLAVVVVVQVVYDSVNGLSAMMLLVRLVLIVAVAWCVKLKWASFR